MRALPLPPRAAWLALAASVVAHATLLGGDPAREEATQAPRAVQVALLPPTLPVALPEPAPAAQPEPRVPSPRPGAAPQPTVDGPATASEASLLRLAGPASWRYRLRQAGQDGDAELTWEPQPDGRYQLRLTRRIGERALLAWESLGRTGVAGLAPERFALQQRGQDRQAINFDNEGRRISFSASPARHELPSGAQDRLSWWLQLAAVVQASPTPGGRWRVWVAGVRGELREWTFETVDPVPEDGGTLHLRRQPLGPYDPGVDLWLDPARSYWPVRLRQGDPETRGYEIVLTDVNS